MSENTKPLAIENKGFDPGEVDAPSVALYGGLIIAIIIAVFLGVTLFWDKFLNGRFKDVVEGSPNAQIEDLHKREDAALSGYRFVDKGKGQVRIPLDRAMQLLVSEVQAGKSPYNTRDTVKPAEPVVAAVPAVAAATSAPAAVPEHH